MVDFGIPLFANIHLCGSVLTEVFFVMTVSQILYGKIPSVGTMVLFCMLLGIFAIGAPGVPGGTVMASLGLITGILLFDGTGTALMLTIFALQDSFGLQRDRRRCADAHPDRLRRQAQNRLCGNLCGVKRPGENRQYVHLFQSLLIRWTFFR